MELNIENQDQNLNYQKNGKENKQGKKHTNDNNKKEEEVLLNSIKADGGAYKGKPKNDYCLHFVETGERPQNFILDYEEEKRFLHYPKLNELIKLKNEVLKKRATPAMWLKCDLKTFDLSTLGKFDVILIDPPLPEYYRRAKAFGVDLTAFEPWTFDEIQNLRVDLIADNCCFLFLLFSSILFSSIISTSCFSSGFILLLLLVLLEVFVVAIVFSGLVFLVRFVIFYIWY